MTINGATFHIRFKCSVEDRNQRMKLIRGHSGHRTSFRRIFDNGSILAHRVSLYFSSYENSMPLNLDEVYCFPRGRRGQGVALRRSKRSTIASWRIPSFQYADRIPGFDAVQLHALTERGTMMNDHSLAFLKRLLATPGPSGDEVAIGRIWQREAETFADQVYANVCGSSYAVLEGRAPRVLLAGHIDEIGVMVSAIDDDGFLSFSPIGGWDPQVLVGQRVRLAGRTGDVIGVIGRNRSIR
jgi:hypothetical protein